MNGIATHVTRMTALLSSVMLASCSSSDKTFPIDESNESPAPVVRLDTTRDAVDIHQFVTLVEPPPPGADVLVFDRRSELCGSIELTNSGTTDVCFDPKRFRGWGVALYQGVNPVPGIDVASRMATKEEIQTVTPGGTCVLDFHLRDFTSKVAPGRYQLIVSVKCRDARTLEPIRLQWAKPVYIEIR